MPANSPAEICRIFQQSMAEGDIDLVLSIYDPEVVFLNELGEVKKGKEELREELAPLVAQKANFDFNIKQITEAGDIALMHTEWKVSLPQQVMSTYAIEVARRQPDGSWCWLIGDPFTVEKYLQR